MVDGQSKVKASTVFAVSISLAVYLFGDEIQLERVY